MIRVFDFLFSLIGILALSLLLILVWIFVFFENGFPIFKQMRVGRHQKPFILFKFRTMPISTKSVATHLVKNLKLSFFSTFLRKTKLDETLQLWNVLKGEMSLVGPRPCLLSQTKLIKERKKRGVFKVRPGITGLAQIKGITMKTPTLLAKIDLEMIKHMNLFYYFYYVFQTLLLIFRKRS